jgi:hypothetical protein
MKSYAVAAEFNKFVPGVQVPRDLLDKLKRVKKESKSKAQKREKYDKVNIEFFAPFIAELKKSGLCVGCHIMSVHYVEIIPKILAEAKIKNNVTPQKATPSAIASSS